MRYFCTILLILACVVHARASEVLVLDEKFRVREGEDLVDYFLSIDTTISVAERYLSMKEGSPEQVKRYLFVTTQSQKWLFFKVYNPRETPVDLLIEMGDYGLSEADFYIFQNDTLLQNGNIAKRGGLRTSSFYDRKIIIPFKAQPGENYDFLLNIHTNAPLFSLPVIFWDKQNKITVSQGMEFGRGIFYGVLAFFILITGLVVYLIRNRSYLFYWLYLSLGGLLLLMKSGIPLEVFWPGRSYVDFIITNFFLFAYMLVTLQFLKEFLSYRIPQGKHIILINVLIVIGVILTISYIPFSYFKIALQDFILIGQTIYINATNVFVMGIIFWAFPKIKDKFVLFVSLLYFFIFSAYLFNPFIEFGFWTGKAIGHIIVYSGGLTIGILLATLTAIRFKNVFEMNRNMKAQLSDLNRYYSFSLIEGQEKERRRVAEELHDGTGAHLSAVKMKLSMLKSQVQDEDKKEFLERIIENVDQSCLQVREMSHELMPPTLLRFGIAASLQDMVQRFQQEYPIKIVLKSNLNRVSPDETSQVVLFRTILLLLQALVHSQCRKAEIRIAALPSIKSVTIRVQYTEGGADLIHEIEQNGLKGLIDLLQGRLDNIMSSIWEDEINIEIPIAYLYTEEEEE